MGSLVGALQGLSTLGTSIATDVAVTSGPQLIPGTSAVAIPNASGGFSIANLGVNSTALILILAVGAIVLVVMLKKK